jgi:hypothetical protein
MEGETASAGGDRGRQEHASQARRETAAQQGRQDGEAHDQRDQADDDV